MSYPVRQGVDARHAYGDLGRKFDQLSELTGMNACKSLTIKFLDTYDVDSLMNINIYKFFSTSFMLKTVNENKFSITLIFKKVFSTANISSKIVAFSKINIIVSKT